MDRFEHKYKIDSPLLILFAMFLPVSFLLFVVHLIIAKNQDLKYTSFSVSHSKFDYGDGIDYCKVNGGSAAIIKNKDDIAKIQSALIKTQSLIEGRIDLQCYKHQRSKRKVIEQILQDDQFIKNSNSDLNVIQDDCCHISGHRSLAMKLDNPFDYWCYKDEDNLNIVCQRKMIGIHLNETSQLIMVQNAIVNYWQAVEICQNENSNLLVNMVPKNLLSIIANLLSSDNKNISSSFWISHSKTRMPGMASFATLDIDLQNLHQITHGQARFQQRKHVFCIRKVQSNKTPLSKNANQNERFTKLTSLNTSKQSYPELLRRFHQSNFANVSNHEQSK